MDKPITLYSKVRTPDGTGTVISLECKRVNGLQYDTSWSEACVWYGTDGARESGWVQRVYDLKDIALEMEAPPETTGHCILASAARRIAF